jgi:hypothetical protein
VQDVFRGNQSLTLNYGFRWEFDGTIHSTNGIDGMPTNGSFFGPSTQLFAPGSLNGNQNPALSQSTPRIIATSSIPRRISASPGIPPAVMD